MQNFANDLETVIRSTYDHPLHDIWPLWYWLIHLQDSLQAFSSSIAGLLSSRAVLQGNVAHVLVPTGSIVVTSRVWQITDQHGSVGVGVGDASASPTAALLLSVIQESMGRIATILFAHRLGTSLEPECKMYRLAADVFNDTAMIFDCLSPALPKAPRVILLSLSSVLRALCGVAAGSSKASLSAHFAKWGNLGELNAVSPPIFFGRAVKYQRGKTWPQYRFLFSLGYNLQIYIVICPECLLIFKQKDSSQETIVSLMGYVHSENYCALKRSGHKILADKSGGCSPFVWSLHLCCS